MKNKIFYISSMVIIVMIFLGMVVLSNRDSDKIGIKLIKCVDGDTAWFKVNDKDEKVRFLGIDTPESVHPNGIVDDYGIEASDYTCNMLKSANNIYIEYDVNSKRRDKYNRLLGYVYVDNNNLVELLLSKGYAEVKYIYGNYKYIDSYCNIQKQAYNDKLGIWNSKKYEDNYCYWNNY